MREEILKISEKLELNIISADEAQTQLLCLFGIIKSLCPECGNEKKRLWSWCTDCSIRKDEE